MAFYFLFSSYPKTTRPARFVADCASIRLAGKATVSFFVLPSVGLVSQLLLRGAKCRSGLQERTPGKGNVKGNALAPNFGGLILSNIKADVCKLIFSLQNF